MGDEKQSNEPKPLSFEQARRQFPNIHLLKSRKFSRLDEKSQNQADQWILAFVGIDANDPGWEDRFAFVAEEREFLKIANEIQRKLVSPEPTLEEKLLAKLDRIERLLKERA